MQFLLRVDIVDGKPNIVHIMIEMKLAEDIACQIELLISIDMIAHIMAMNLGRYM